MMQMAPTPLIRKKKVVKRKKGFVRTSATSSPAWMYDPCAHLLPASRAGSRDHVSGRKSLLI